jgi:hypothetical protein
MRSAKKRRKKRVSHGGGRKSHERKKIFKKNTVTGNQKMTKDDVNENITLYKMSKI